MAQEAVNPWEPFFDPLDDALWARGSDVDWLKGTWVHAYTHPASLHERHPFIPVTVKQAEHLVRRHPGQVLAILVRCCHGACAPSTSLSRDWRSTWTASNRSTGMRRPYGARCCGLV